MTVIFFLQESFVSCSQWQEKKESALIFLETVCIIDNKRCDILLIFGVPMQVLTKQFERRKKMRLRKVDFPEVFRWNWKENYGACFAIIIWYSLKTGITDSSISSIFWWKFLVKRKLTSNCILQCVSLLKWDIGKRQAVNQSKMISQNKWWCWVYFAFLGPFRIRKKHEEIYSVSLEPTQFLIKRFARTGMSWK